MVKHGPISKNEASQDSIEWKSLPTISDSREMLKKL